MDDRMRELYARYRAFRDSALGPYGVPAKAFAKVPAPAIALEYDEKRRQHWGSIRLGGFTVRAWTRMEEEGADTSMLGEILHERDGSAPKEWQATKATPPWVTEAVARGSTPQRPRRARGGTLTCIALDRGRGGYYVPANSYMSQLQGLWEAGFSKAEADVLARHYVRQDLKRLRTAGDDWVPMAVFVEVLLGGVVLASDNVGGIESDCAEAAGQLAMELAESCVEAAREKLQELLREALAQETFYVLVVTGMVEPSLDGPYESTELRDAAARKIWKDLDPGENGVFQLSITGTAVEVAAYVQGSLDVDAEEPEGDA